MDILIFHNKKNFDRMCVITTINFTREKNPKFIVMILRILYNMGKDTIEPFL